MEQWNKVDNKGMALEDVNILLNDNRRKAALTQGDKLNLNAKLTQVLAAIVRRYDPTRPITAGCNEVSPENK